MLDQVKSVLLSRNDPFAISRQASALLWGTVGCLLLLAWVRTAWVCDDAFITMRVVENTLNGFGPVWNVSERVQVYTHPAWFLILLPVLRVVGDGYFAALVPCAICTAATFALLARLAPDRMLLPILIVASLLWSQAFVDFSSSGLENSLVHCLVVAFAIVTVRPETDVGARLAQAAFVAALLFLTRPDAWIFTLPVLLNLTWRAWHVDRRALLTAGIATGPAVAWLLFATIYYGSPVPNTALAKLGTGIDWSARIAQASAYFSWSVNRDPVSMFLLVAAPVNALFVRRAEPLLLSIGLGLQLAYVAWTGADYMGGRFFSAPVVLACATLITCTRFRMSHRFRWLFAGAIAFALIANVNALERTVLSPIDMRPSAINAAGIADERGFYYHNFGVMRVLRNGGWQSNTSYIAGTKFRGPGVLVLCTVGLIPYVAGPDAHWIDPLALTDPLLARLPARDGTRVGHFERAFPKGYLATISDGKVRIENESIKVLYADVLLATQGDLFTAKRWAAIWRLLLRSHRIEWSDQARNDIEIPGVPLLTRSPESCYGQPYGRIPIVRVAGDRVHPPDTRAPGR